MSGKSVSRAVRSLTLLNLELVLGEERKGVLMSNIMVFLLVTLVYVTCKKEKK